MSVVPRPFRDESPIAVLRVGPERGLGGRVATILEDEGFQTATAPDGQSALERIADRRGGPECLIVSDDSPTIAPLSVAQSVSAADPAIPIVLCTNDESAYTAGDVVDAGVSTIITEADLEDRSALRERIRTRCEQYRDRVADRQDASLLSTMLEGFPVRMYATDENANCVRGERGSATGSGPGLAESEIPAATDDTGPYEVETDQSVLEDGEAIKNVESYSPAQDRWFLESKVPWYDSGELVGMAGLSIDITDRKEREQELRASTQLLRTIVGTSPAAIVVHDVDGTVQFWNTAAADLFGWSAREAIRDPRPPYVPDDGRGRFADLVDRVVEEGSVGPIGYRGRTRDGRMLDLQLSATVLDGGEDPSRIVSVLTDVTELKERERRLERQNERLESFARVLAHDLRNPVQVIRGQIDRADPIDPTLVSRATDRIESIVEDVLTVSREDPLVTETERVRLSALAVDVWGQLETREATLDVASDCTFEGDRTRVHRLLGHLFENAVEHGGSSVTVSVGRLHDGFFVADDGRGLSDDDRSRPFEPGYSSDPNGTGFGLNLVREIVEAHGWQIELLADGEGTRFEITGVETIEGTNDSAIRSQD